MKRILLAALLLSACGKEEKLKPEQNGGSDLNLADFNSEQGWVPVRKVCNDAAIPFKSYETYQLDKDLLLASYINENTDVRRCAIGEAYYRSIGSVTNTKELFVENGRFESTNYAKQVCYQIENGKPVGKPEETMLQVQLQSWTYKLERSQMREMVITSKDHPECLNGAFSTTLRF
jgi:hypothetical protein